MRRVEKCLVLIAFLLIPACVVRAEPVMLAYKFVPGSIDKYKMVMSMDMNLVGAPQGREMPPMNMGMSMVVTEKVLGVLPDGSAKIRVSYSGFKMTGAAAQKAKGKLPQTPTVPTVVVTRTTDGRIIKLEGLHKLPIASSKYMDMGPFMKMMGNEGVLPVGPVEVGESWTRQVPLPFGNSSASVTCTLQGTEARASNRNAARIQQAIDGRMDLGEMLKAMVGAMPFKAPDGSVVTGITGHIDLMGSMDYLFSPAIGKMLSSKGFADVSLSMNLPEAAQKMGGPPSVSMLVTMKFDFTKLG